MMQEAKVVPRTPPAERPGEGLPDVRLGGRVVGDRLAGIQAAKGAGVHSLEKSFAGPNPAPSTCPEGHNSASDLSAESVAAHHGPVAGYRFCHKRGSRQRKVEQKEEDT